MKCRDDFMDVTGIDPFKKSIIIASACNLVFRTNFLQPVTIAFIPHHDYNPERKQSIKAMQCIKYLSLKEGLNVQHAKNGGEERFGPYLVDGYYKAADGQYVVLEFHRNFCHGNPAKYMRDTISPVRQLTIGELYDKTLEKGQYIESLGYVYGSMWKPDFCTQCQEDSELITSIKVVELVTPLEAREAFHGGRTEAFTLYKEASDDEGIY